mmetsp:Transcript_145966/g.254847  ORF Transcript_145966/g.254847 Transcript_145966/m.254847 type:complete len:763 (+) Transcript_145966:825-3113(+)
MLHQALIVAPPAVVADRIEVRPNGHPLLGPVDVMDDVVPAPDAQVGQQLRAVRQVKEPAAVLDHTAGGVHLRVFGGRLPQGPLGALDGAVLQLGHPVDILDPEVPGHLRPVGQLPLAVDLADRRAAWAGDDEVLGHPGSVGQAVPLVVGQLDDPVGERLLRRGRRLPRLRSSWLRRLRLVLLATGEAGAAGAGAEFSTEAFFLFVCRRSCRLLRHAFLASCRNRLQSTLRGLLDAAIGVLDPAVAVEDGAIREQATAIQQREGPVGVGEDELPVRHLHPPVGVLDGAVRQPQAAVGVVDHPVGELVGPVAELDGAPREGGHLPRGEGPQVLRKPGDDAAGHGGARGQHAALGGVDLPVRQLDRPVGELHAVVRVPQGPVRQEEGVVGQPVAPVVAALRRLPVGEDDVAVGPAGGPVRQLHRTVGVLHHLVGQAVRPVGQELGAGRDLGPREDRGQEPRGGPAGGVGPPVGPDDGPVGAARGPVQLQDVAVPVLDGAVGKQLRAVREPVRAVLQQRGVAVVRQLDPPIGQLDGPLRQLDVAVGVLDHAVGQLQGPVRHAQPLHDGVPPAGVLEAGRPAREGPVGPAAGAVGEADQPVGELDAVVGEDDVPVGQPHRPVRVPDRPVGQLLGPVREDHGPVGPLHDPVQLAEGVVVQEVRPVGEEELAVDVGPHDGPVRAGEEVVDAADAAVGADDGLVAGPADAIGELPGPLLVEVHGPLGDRLPPFTVAALGRPGDGPPIRGPDHAVGVHVAPVDLADGPVGH